MWEKRPVAIMVPKIEFNYQKKYFIFHIINFFNRFLRCNLQSPGRWTTAGEVFPVRQLGACEISSNRNESLSIELQEAIKRLSKSIPRSTTNYSMNYRPKIKVS